MLTSKTLAGVGQNDTLSDDEIFLEEEKVLAVHLLRRANPNRFGDLVTRLDEAAILGRDE